MSALLEHRPRFAAKAPSRKCEDCGETMPFVALGKTRLGSFYGWQCLDCGLVRPEWWDRWIEVSAIVQSWRKPRVAQMAREER